MCGIAGIVNMDGRPVARAELAAMTDALAHRGPDGDGLHLDGPVGLGQRRLAIIDLVGGIQPMANEDDSVWVSFNGEIYNYKELHRDLESRGHRFRSCSDTEVIVHAYEEWGARCVEHFRGMFAFAIHDRRRGEVFVARDRLGIKPLVYSRQANRIAFASELQSLETLPGLPLRLNLAAVDAYLHLGYIPAPATIYHDVYKLPPGHTMTLGPDGIKDGPRRYWDVAFEPEENRSEQQWLEELDATIRESVRLRLRSDVPFGAFLSGGVDSSLVVGYMAELLGEPVRTFSIGFEEADHSELDYARIAAKRCRTQHHEQVLRPDALKILPALVKHYGEPFGDSSAIPTYYVSQLARQHVKMVLSGDGGDENFAGYFQHLHASGYRRPVRRSFKAVLRDTAVKAAQCVGLMPCLTPLDQWGNIVALVSAPERRHFWKASGRVTPLAAELRTTYSADRTLDLCSWFQYFDIKNYLPYDILTKVDIASMYHGLEARVPLLDHHVVELAARIPVSFKVRRESENAFEGKYILKKLAERLYDREFLTRPKKGFAIPLQSWLGAYPQGELRERLFDGQGRLVELLQRPCLEEATTWARQPHALHATRLWLLLFLAEWFRQHPKVSL
jgi:asparagine synthase (glutamine-hydrolysing)